MYTSVVPTAVRVREGQCESDRHKQHHREVTSGAEQSVLINSKVCNFLQFKVTFPLQILIELVKAPVQ